MKTSRAKCLIAARPRPRRHRRRRREASAADARARASRSAPATLRPSRASSCAGASPTRRARSSSTSQRRLSNSQLTSVANWASPATSMRGLLAGQRAHQRSAGFEASTADAQVGRRPARSSPHHSSRPAGVTRKASGGRAGSSAGQPSSCSSTLRPACSRRRCGGHRLAAITMVGEEDGALDDRRRCERLQAVQHSRIVGTASQCPPRFEGGPRRGRAQNPPTPNR